MVDKQNSLGRMLGLMAVVLLALSLLTPMIVTSENTDAIFPDEYVIHGEDWIIDGVTEYINVSGSEDHNIIIRNNGALHINNATLTLMIDGYNPHRITVESGGRLVLWNSIVETQLTDETVLRPFLKTNITARSGSSIILRENSAFAFPGWVYIDNSELILTNSEFRGIPSGNIPPTLPVNDNNDCPMLMAVNDSYVLIEDSKISSYYINNDIRYEEWTPSQIGPGDTTVGQSRVSLYANDNDFYEIAPGRTMEIIEWFTAPTLAQAIDHVNPRDRLKNLHIEIIYKTDEGYDGVGASVEYSNSTVMKQAMSIRDTTGQKDYRYTGIWEFDLSTFHRSGSLFLKDLTLSLYNPASTGNISVDKINLVSAYDNSILIIDSELIVINSEIDVDYRRAQPSLIPGVQTDQTTYMMDYNPEHRVIKLFNSDMKAYGLYPMGAEAEYVPQPDGDPPIIGDEASHDRIWLYRWVTVKPMDSSEAPLANARVTGELDIKYKDVSEDLYDNVMMYIDPYNNPEAWDYVDRSGMGTFHPDGYYVTNSQGLALMFLISDRLNYPIDWPNSRFVGDYYVNVTDDDLGFTSRDLSLPPFPQMNRTKSNILEEIIYQDEIPLPNLDITEDDILFLVDGAEVDTVRNNIEVEIQATIGNIGNLAATDVPVHFYIFDYIEEEFELIDQTTISVGPGGSTETSVFWTSYMHPYGGEGFVIRVHVNPYQNPIERDYENNEAFSYIYVTEKPDLIPVEFGISHDDIYAGEYLTITTRVQNIGLWESVATRVTFYVDHGTDNEEIINTLNIPALGSGQTSGPIEATWRAALVESPLNETRTITVRVNYPMLEQNEENVSNNWDNRSIEVMNPADLVVSPDHIHFSEVLPQVGRPVVITARVWNIGGEEVSTIVRFLDEDIIIGDVPVTLASQEWEDVTITWTPDIRGYREVTVHVDPYEEEYELIRDNNIASVLQPIFSDNYQFDLIVNNANSPVTRGTFVCSGFVVVMESGRLSIQGGATKANFQISQDRDHQFGFIVMNQGTLEINRALIHSGYHTSIEVSDSGSVNITDSSIVYDMVEVHTSGNSALTVRNSEVEGTLLITGNDFNFYESYFRSNNIYVRPSNIIGVNSTFTGRLDDLHDTTGRFTKVVTPAIEMTGTSVIEVYRWWRITTVAHGNIHIGGSVVSISGLIDGYSDSGVTGAGGMVYIHARTDILTPTVNNFVGNYEISATYSEKGQTFQVPTSQVSLPAYPSGQHDVTTTLTFSDLLLPDLSITDDRVSTDVSVVSAGDTVVITARVNNIGYQDAINVTVEFYLVVGEDEFTLIGTDTIETIRVDRSGVAAVTWISNMTDFELRLEERTILVRIDPDVDPLSDHNVANNIASTIINVRAPPNLRFLLPEIILEVGGSAIVDDSVIERDDLHIFMQAVNDGGTDVVNASVEITYSGGLIASYLVDMPLDEVVNITTPWEIDIRGEQTITIWVNSSREDPLYSVSIRRDLDIVGMEMTFSGLSMPLTDQDMGATILVEGILERTDGKTLGNMDVTISLRDGDNNITSTVVTTDQNGRFEGTLITPERAGSFTVWIIPEHPNGEYHRVGSFNVAGEVSAIPWWLLLIIVVAAVGSVGGIILFIKYKGEGEWVECGACGATIPVDSDACPMCGTAFEMDTVKCSECGEWIPTDSFDCPSCGAEFITTGKAIEEYKETMERQYEEYVNRHRAKARQVLGSDVSEDEFMNWWMTQPGYMTFDEWLDQEEERRRRGGIECKECGSINPMDEAICQKCGSSLVKIDPTLKRDVPLRRKKKPTDADELDLDELDEELFEEQTEDKVVKKVKKRPTKVTKTVKKVKK